ncbi:hypothetical protein EDM00_08075 [Ornithobacterium rhinotracheale]|nr:hypothetical protein [Ornithobacterium rhinotracheale]
MAQEKLPTSTESHMFWQPETKITIDDYQGNPNPEVEKINNKYGIAASSSVGIWSVLDIPKRKRDRLRKFEKVYIAPAFEKTTSYYTKRDTLEIAKQNLYFDICEVCARIARKMFSELQSETNSTGIISMEYTSVINKVQALKKQMFNQYFRDVFIDKKAGAFDAWKKEVKEMLDENKEWATTPKDCYRMVIKQPIDKDYIMSPHLYGELN